ncbi:uncharacterized protein I303_102492 [Kwoniella dejecticola CBS 10117]|uniref:Uncharacterized protein n=1 Tax=Kwoniella dejecticola CBS 10117 TaxID=1296121 RepID=A0A1A6A8W4_9TREE|nr:uncharacterized protein I303_02506 [Kwoniella dejecticola CBS 10117]OBR86498.1 hypothetical protein I303_02506 [Kwoniella dejecticola CBS 10117]
MSPSSFWHSNDQTPSGGGMTTSLGRTGSVTRSRNVMTPSVNSKRSSALLKASTTMDFGALSPSVESDLMNETAGLKKVIEGLNKTNLGLRARIADLESHIEHNTGPEVERLSKELSTLEDLFASSQKDNEAHYAEGERTKAYVKELENLLTTSLGADWQESHKLYPPSVPSTVVTASTPLPPPKTTNPLRHSVSFSGKRFSSRLHKRASSVMDLGLIALQAVKEDDGRNDDTPTGALRKLSRSTSSKAPVSSIAQQERLDDKVLCATPQPSPSKLSSSTRSKTLETNETNIEEPSERRSEAAGDNDRSKVEQPNLDSAALSGIDVAALNQVLRTLSGLDPTEMAALSSSMKPANTAISKLPESPLDVSRRERNEHIGTMRRMLEDQQKILRDRETRLNDIIQLAKDKVMQYAIKI